MNRFLVTSLVIGIVSGCGSSGSAASPSPATTPGATHHVRPPFSRRSPRQSFPTAAFAAISEDPVPEDVAAKFQAVLDDMAAGGGIAATVMTPDGTWSGAAGTADGVHDIAAR